MLKIMFLIILSPFAIFCAILSIAIIYAMLKKVIEKIIDCMKVINDSLNNRDDKQC